MHQDAKEVVEAVINKARGGDMVAAQFILERLCPPRKGRAVEFELPAVNTPRMLSQHYQR